MKRVQYINPDWLGHSHRANMHQHNKSDYRKHWQGFKIKR